MQSHERNKSTWKLRAAAAVLVVMAAVLLGWGIAGDARAVDDPRQQRKAEKKAVAPKNVVPKNVLPGPNHANPTVSPKREAPKAPTSTVNANPKAGTEKGGINQAATPNA